MFAMGRKQTRASYLTKGWDVKICACADGVHLKQGVTSAFAIRGAGLKKKGYAISSDKVDGVRTYRGIAPE